MEFGVELTYPLSESTAASIILSVSQVLGSIVTMETGWLYVKYGAFWAIFNLAFLLFIGSICTAFVSNKLYRQTAIQEANQKMNVEYTCVKNKDDV